MQTKQRKPVLSLLSLLLFVIFVIVYGDKGLRYLLLYLSHASWARDLVTGFPLAWRVAGRFVAGETVQKVRAAKLG